MDCLRENYRLLTAFDSGICPFECCSSNSYLGAAAVGDVVAADIAWHMPGNRPVYSDNTDMMPYY